MSIHNIVFFENLTKIMLQLSSNTHLISSFELSHLLVNAVNVMKHWKTVGIAEYSKGKAK